MFVHAHKETLCFTYSDMKFEGKNPMTFDLSHDIYPQLNLNIILIPVSFHHDCVEHTGTSNTQNEVGQIIDGSVHTFKDLIPLRIGQLTITFLHYCLATFSEAITKTSFLCPSSFPICFHIAFCNKSRIVLKGLNCERLITSQ